MPDPRRLPLRVLYTINSSPQYILARSLGPVLVTPVNDSQPYCTVSFKTCLETISRSSPELVHDHSRDFSVYVLDPLESNSAPAPMDISNSNKGRATQTSCTSDTNHPRGVAVGMGLMSLALSTGNSDAMTVVGTFAKTGAGQEAVEVIFALRETLSNSTKSRTSSHSRAMPQDDNHKRGNDGSLCSTTLATIASIQMRTKAKTKPKKAPRVSSTPVTESDKLMSANTYIGPLKKKGRPKGPSASDAKIKAEESASTIPQERITTSSLAAPNPVGTSSMATSIHPAATNADSHRSLQTSDSPVNPASYQSDLTSLAAVFSTTHSKGSPNTSLLTALSLIDSSADQTGLQAPVNPTFVDALRQLLVTAYANARVPDPPLPHTTIHSTNVQSIPASDEDVALDKENVNPTVSFRHHLTYDEMKLNDNTSDPSTELSANRRPEPLPPQNRGFGARSLENSPPKAQATTPTASADASSLRRKRTLSEFMDEKDNNRSKSNKNRNKDKGRSDRKETSHSIYTQQHNYDSGLRHYPRILASTLPRPEPGTHSYYRTPLDAQSSPPRPSRSGTADLKPRSPDPLGGTSRHRPIVIPDSPQAPRVSASSPIKPTNRPRKTYTVPEWARTNTATQPRLSEDAQRALETAEQKKKEERQLNRRKSNAAAQERARQRGKTPCARNTEPSSENSEPMSSQNSMQPPSQLILAKSDLPPIVASSNTGPILLLSSGQRARSPSPKPGLQPLLPVTPKRPSRIASFTPKTTGSEEDSLFTPLSAIQESGGATGPLPSPALPTSPLSRKKLRFSSPRATKQPGSESSIITVRLTKSSESNLGKSKNLWEDESAEALEDLDCPPSSLPIASSDIDIDDTSVYDANADEEDAVPPRQHWIGLPPSSPPPPMSPTLMPVDDDGDITGNEMDDTDLPIASETDEADNEPHDNGTLSMTESDWAPSPGDDPTMSMGNLPPGTQVNQGSVEDMVFFTQYANSVGKADVLLGLEGGPPMNNDAGGLFSHDIAANMDFSEFWESFKPLLHQDGSAPNPTEQAFDFNLDEIKEAGMPLSGELDHTKLAEDIQALFSGCLV